MAVLVRGVCGLRMVVKMMINRKTGKLEAKPRRREIETVVIIREECEVCDGTGLIHDEQTYDCYKCQGRGMVQVSERKSISHE